MNAPEIVRPDFAALLGHLGEAAFLLGVRDKRWRLDDIVWPQVLIYVSADVRSGAPSEYLFRFECTGYPRTPATASLWDKATGSIPPPTRWPGGRSRVPSVFRPDWKDGKALYLPCDRISIEGHDGWRTKHPSQLWSQKLGIVRYLEVVSELLNSSDYSGLRSA